VDELFTEPSVPRRILIVDDDSGIRGLLAAVCRRSGYICGLACDGLEALRSIESTHYDVVLLDLMMPRVNGFQVIEALKENASPPAVIVISAQGGADMAALLDTAFVKAIVRKPFDTHMVISLISAVAGSAAGPAAMPAE
jgi:DNA-binding response OmpR family regulator